MSTEVIGMAEAADIVGVAKSNFSAHRAQYAGEGQCPAPTVKLTCGPVWAGQEKKAMDRWAKEFAKIRTTRAERQPVAPAASVKKAAPAKAAASKTAAKPVGPVAKKFAATKAAAPAPEVPVEAPVTPEAKVSKKTAPKAAAPKKKGLFGKA